MPRAEAGFSKGAVPGMKTADAETVARTVSGQQSGVERDFSGARQAKIINRAERGNIKFFCSRFDGLMYPDSAIDDDKTTWLQPGEEMTVPFSAALHFCGNVWDPKANEASDIIEKYGGYLMEAPPQKGLTGGPPPMNRIGPPPFLPDLLVVQVDQRGSEMGERLSIYDRYVPAKQVYGRRQRPHEAEAQEAELKDTIAELAAV